MKNTWKKLAVIALAAAMVLALAACGSGSSEEKDETETYTVVMEPTFPPFDTTNDDGDLDGFDYDMVKAIAKDQGFKVEFKNMEFQSLIPAIQAGDADIIASGMNAQDPARRKKVDFTDTYYKSGLVLMVKKDNSTITGVDTLTSDMKVASQTGTTGADKVTELEKSGKIGTGVILDGFDTCVLQCQNGDVDAVIIDKPVAEEYMKKHEGVFKIVGETMNAEEYGMAVKKGNKELLKKLNDGLADIVEDGTFQKLCDKWNIDNKFAK